MILSFNGYGQVYSAIINIPPTQNSILISEINASKAVSINVGLNMTMRGFNRFILEDEYAQINLRSMRNNFNTLPVWDTNQFTTNFIGHPYHGSIYFNSARTNGFNFYESILFNLGGSLMWEYLMETKPPSRNDLGATIFGGTALGEISYRLSDLFIDNRKTGPERFGREFLAGLMSPARFITRLTTGEVWKSQSMKGNHLSTYPHMVEFYMGIKSFEEINSERNITRFTVGTDIEYGDIIGTDAQMPYEWFRFGGEVEFGSNYFHLTQINSIGLLLRKDLYQTSDGLATAGLFQHFNYYNINPANDDRVTSKLYFSETASIGPGLVYQQWKGFSITQIGIYLGGIILGASISDHLEIGDRDYNYGSGFSLKLNSSVQWKERLLITISSESYLLFSWKGLDDYDILKEMSIEEIDFLNVQGDKSRAKLHLLELNMRYILNESAHFFVRTRQFYRNTSYDYFPKMVYQSEDLLFGIGLFV